MPLDPELQERGAGGRGDAAFEGAAPDRASGTASVGIDSPAVQNAPVGIYAVDASGIVRAWNRRAGTVFGWDAAEVLGHPLPFLPAEVRAAATDGVLGLDGLADALRRVGDDRPIQRADGTTVHVLTEVLVQHDEGSGSLIAFVTDVTARREATQRLQETKHRWRTLLTRISDTVSILAEDGTVKESTAEFTEVLGFPTEWWSGRSAFELLHPDDIDEARRLWEALLAEPGVDRHTRLRMRRNDGAYEHVAMTGINLLHDDAVQGVVLVTRNVTEERRAETLLADETRVLELIARDAPLDETLPAIVHLVEEHSGGMTCLVRLTPDGRHLEVAAGGSVPVPLLQLIEATPLVSPTGETPRLRRAVVVGDFGTDPRFAPYAGALEAVGIRAGWAVPVMDRRTELLLGVLATCHSTPTEPGSHEREVASVAAHLASIAIERAGWQGQLFHQARHHQLTGLPNRALILETLDTALERARAHGSTLAVMFIDLDRFKAINDSFGHAAGDRLLTRFAGRLRNAVRPDDFVGHFGADEFVVIVEDVRSEDDLRLLGNRISGALSEPFALDEGEVFLTASIGVALALAGRESSETVLQHADVAMYRAKELGRDRMELFDHALRTRAAEQLRTDQDLRAAIRRHELELHYQPIIDLRSGRIEGVEALLRWNHPERGLVLPTRFLDIAEDGGTIVQIGAWALDEAIAQAARWVRDDGIDVPTLAVNLSARQLATPGIVKQVAESLADHDWPAHQLVLELTETFLSEDREAGLAVLTELKGLGVRLAVDDFGTGYSSLSFLHRFPFDIVKIDPAFVAPVAASGGGSPVAAAVLHMANALDLVVVAEGVEEQQQLDGLRTLGCHLAQGYLFAEALPADDLPTLLAGAPTW